MTYPYFQWLIRISAPLLATVFALALGLAGCASDGTGDAEAAKNAAAFGIEHGVFCRVGRRLSIGRQIDIMLGLHGSALVSIKRLSVQRKARRNARLDSR